MGKLGLALIQYIVFSRNNPVVVINGLVYGIRFTYLWHLKGFVAPGYIADLKSPSSRVGEAPRATPCGLARLPNIYLSERYQISQIQLLAMYVGEIQTIVNCQIRVFFISDPQFISLAEIILQNRIFEWDRPVDR